MGQVVAADFFVVPTATCRLLFVPARFSAGTKLLLNRLEETRH